MQTLHELPTPALLLDYDVLKANLTHMAHRADKLGVRLRPHLKTHKCVEIAKLQRDLGAKGVAVATLYEADVFARAGFEDITWAFPVIINRLYEVAQISKQIRLKVVVDSVVAVEALERAGLDIEVQIKVDCGYHRAGVDPEGDELVGLAVALSKSSRLELGGILTHSGHAYSASDRKGIAAVAADERNAVVTAAERLHAMGLEVGTVSVGSTPAMCAVASLEGVNEARPGNYVFYDYMQVLLGSCAVSNCALTVLASVISSGSKHAIVDAGALTLSMDSGLNSAPTPTMGEIFSDYERRQLNSKLRVSGVSQEHGKLTGPLKVGTRVRMLMNHACLTAACFDEYVVVQGDCVIDRWPIYRGR